MATTVVKIRINRKIRILFTLINKRELHSSSTPLPYHKKKEKIVKIYCSDEYRQILGVFIQYLYFWRKKTTIGSRKKRKKIVLSTDQLISISHLTVFHFKYVTGFISVTNIGVSDIGIKSYWFTSRLQCNLTFSFNGYHSLSIQFF